jgi:hypothetical protein
MLGYVPRGLVEEDAPVGGADRRSSCLDPPLSAPQGASLIASRERVTMRGITRRITAIDPRRLREGLIHEAFPFSSLELFASNVLSER